MRPLETITDSPGETPEDLKIHVSTGEECSGSGTYSTQDLSPGIDGTGILRGPRAIRKGTGLS